MRQLRSLLANNPHLLIERVEFDIFGFRPCDAALGNFAMKLLKTRSGC